MGLLAFVPGGGPGQARTRQVGAAAADIWGASLLGWGGIAAKWSFRSYQLFHRCSLGCVYLDAIFH